MQFQTQQASSIDSIRTLAEGLKAASQRQAATVSTLTDYKVTEEDRWAIREQEILTQLGSKAN